MKFIIISLLPFLLYPQQQMEHELDTAFVNAKKGIYWALTNFNPDKNRVDKELISENKLYASVKLTKEFEGVKIESKGYCNSSEITVKIYRSDDFLENEGYLKKDSTSGSSTKKKKL